MDLRRRAGSRLHGKVPFVLSVIALLALGSGPRSSAEDARAFTNSIGMTMVRVESGSFHMGAANPIPPEEMGVPALLAHDTWDETPVRRVTISTPFFISETEITVEQFQRFRFDELAMGEHSPSVSGVSWEDAVAFTEWLSRKEGKSYRLPTEAEWEYAARAGTETLFSSGDRMPGHGEANPWGIRNMHTGVAEWCLDWHGRYPDTDQIDPVGPDDGVARVVRGGGIGSPHFREFAEAPYSRRSASRGGMFPSFSGQHPIGFRVVQAPPSETVAGPARSLFVQEAVVQDERLANRGPDPDEPFFARREMMPVPPENMPQAATVAAGFHPGLGAHSHSPGLVVCPNGDLLVVYFAASASFAEGWPNTTFVATRLRFGSDEWDAPELFYDLPDVNDETGLLWNDRGRIWLFTGGDGLWRAPFRISHSTDNGATWSPITLPFLEGPIGGYYAQPINSAFRDRQGVVYVGTDGLGGSSVLWATRDEGKTWIDTGGRTGGRHTTFALLKDGRILGLGGKSTDIDGYMPRSISEDSGRSWTVSKTPFASLGGNQRPTLIRLASGRLFFAGDFQRNHDGTQPEGFVRKGAYVALSDDEGETWHIKRLPGAAPHESSVFGPGGARGNTRHDEDTIGYSVAKQGPNGVIHLISTMNHPNLHFEMNEAWILDTEAGLTPDEPEAVREVRHEELHPDGSLRGSWGGRILADDRFVLDGEQSWYWGNGRRQYAVTFALGRKRGEETHWSAQGVRDWSRVHREDGSSIWQQWWPNGQQKMESHWKGNRCVGTATHWDRSGEIVGRWDFEDGRLLGPEGEFILSDR